jgi:hypothetical protein
VKETLYYVRWLKEGFELLSLTGGKREELLKSLSSKTGGSNFADKSLQQMKEKLFRVRTNFV